MTLYHPIANLFPLMGDPELTELAADIKKNGLREPITLLEGMILDGRNRARACEIAGRDPLAGAWSYDGNDPVAYVVSANLHRRHLSTAQRAAIAAEIANLKHAGKPVQEMEQISGIPPITQNDAAKLMNVSRDSVKVAKKVRATDTATFEKVKAGEMSLARAERDARNRPALPAKRCKRERVNLIDIPGRPDPVGDMFRLIIEFVPPVKFPRLKILIQSTHIPVLLQKFELALSELNEKTVA